MAEETTETPRARKNGDLTLASLHRKVDEVLVFTEELRPFLPLLTRAARMLDNPVSRFRATVGRRS